MLMRFEPFREFDRITEEMLAERRLRQVPVDAYRRGNELKVALDPPGADSGSIELTVEKDVLTVRATRMPVQVEGDEIVLAERRHGHRKRGTGGRGSQAHRLSISGPPEAESSEALVNPFHNTIRERRAKCLHRDRPARLIHPPEATRVAITSGEHRSGPHTHPSSLPVPRLEPAQCPRCAACTPRRGGPHRANGTGLVTGPPKNADRHATRGLQ
jgi:hypothetical protein